MGHKQQRVYLLKIQQMANGNRPKPVYVLQSCDEQWCFGSAEALLQFLARVTRIGETQ